MYVITLSVIHRQKTNLNQHDTNEEKINFTKMVTGIILCLFICYVPYLIEWQIDVTKVRKACEISTAEVKLLKYYYLYIFNWLLHI